MTGSQVTKYYTSAPLSASFSGATRIAMRKYTIPQYSTLTYLLGDHLGSSSITTDANGNPVATMLYKAWGETRYASGDLNTDYEYTGQRNESEIGLHFYNARWYDSYLNQFTQPDSIVPDPSNPQDWNRYSYTRNNPVRYTDPSGHRACEAEDGHGNCIDLKTSIKIDLESKYRIKIKGGWDEDELISLSDTLSKLATYAGGTENLKDIFQDGMDANGHPDGTLTFDNRAGNSSPAECHGGFACWDYNHDTIVLSDFIFTPEYQPMRQKRSDVSLGIQLTIAHEVVHVFADARPATVGLYGGFVDNPTIMHRPTNGCMNECIYEENMASVIAKYVITGNIKTPDQLKFVLQVQHYWEVWP